MSSVKFRSVKLLRYVSVSDYIIMGCEFVFIAYILYYMIEEIFEVSGVIREGGKRGWVFQLEM